MTSNTHSSSSTPSAVSETHDQSGSFSLFKWPPFRGLGLIRRHPLAIGKRDFEETELFARDEIIEDIATRDDLEELMSRSDDWDIMARDDVEDLFSRSYDVDEELFAREPEPTLPYAVSQGEAGGYSSYRHSRMPSRTARRPSLSERDVFDVEEIAAREDAEDVFARSFEEEDLMSREDAGKLLVLSPPTIAC